MGNSRWEPGHKTGFEDWNPHPGRICFPLSVMCESQNITMCLYKSFSQSKIWKKPVLWPELSWDNIYFQTTAHRGPGPANRLLA